jgi:hypothetical protein
MLSSRGRQYLDIGYQHGALNAYHAQTNPKGVIDLAMAENVK